MKLEIPDKDIEALQIVLDMAHESFDFSGDNGFYGEALENLQKQLRKKEPEK